VLRFVRINQGEGSLKIGQCSPPVMYSQQWSPVPSMTASALELRTQNRSPIGTKKQGAFRGIPV